MKNKKYIIVINKLNSHKIIIKYFMRCFCMIVIKGKNLIFNISIVLFLLGVGIFVAQSQNETNIVSTASLPVSNKIIVLDAGHRSEKMEELL